MCPPPANNRQTGRRQQRSRHRCRRCSVAFFRIGVKCCQTDRPRHLPEIGCVRCQHVCQSAVKRYDKQRHGNIPLHPHGPQLKPPRRSSIGAIFPKRTAKETAS